MRAKQLLIVGFGLPVVCNSEKKPQPDDEIGDGTKCSLFRCKCGGDGQLGNEGDKYTGDNNINKISEEGEEELNEEDKKEFDNAINELSTLGKDVTGYNYSNTKLENLKNILKQEKKSFVEKINDVIFMIKNYKGHEDDEMYTYNENIIASDLLKLKEDVNELLKKLRNEFINDGDLLKNFKTKNEGGVFFDNPKPLGIFGVYELFEVSSKVSNEIGVDSVYKNNFDICTDDNLYIIVDKVNKYVLPYVCCGVLELKEGFLNLKKNHYWAFAYVNNETNKLIKFQQNKDECIIANPSVVTDDSRILKSYVEKEDFIRINSKSGKIKKENILTLSDKMIELIGKYFFE